MVQPMFVHPPTLRAGWRHIVVTDIVNNRLVLCHPHWMVNQNFLRLLSCCSSLASHLWSRRSEGGCKATNCFPNAHSHQSPDVYVVAVLRFCRLRVSNWKACSHSKQLTWWFNNWILRDNQKQWLDWPLSLSCSATSLSCSATYLPFGSFNWHC